jgi:hypothetical protein
VTFVPLSRPLPRHGGEGWVRGFPKGLLIQIIKIPGDYKDNPNMRMTEVSGID